MSTQEREPPRKNLLEECMERTPFPCMHTTHLNMTRSAWVKKPTIGNDENDQTRCSRYRVVPM